MHLLLVGQELLNVLAARELPARRHVMLHEGRPQLWIEGFLHARPGRTHHVLGLGRDIGWPSDAPHAFTLEGGLDLVLRDALGQRALRKLPRLVFGDGHGYFRTLGRFLMSPMIWSTGLTPEAGPPAPGGCMPGGTVFFSPGYTPSLTHISCTARSFSRSIFRDATSSASHGSGY